VPPYPRELEKRGKWGLPKDLVSGIMHTPYLFALIFRVLLGFPQLNPENP